MASVHRTAPSDCKPDIARRLALEMAAEHCSDTCVALWNVTTQTGIPRELRADLKAAVELLRKIRAGVRAADERGRK